MSYVLEVSVQQGGKLCGSC